MLTLAPANTTPIVTPVITFGVYILIARRNGEALDVSRAFTSLSIISLLTNPLATSLSSIPRFSAAMGCFERIQKFLNSETRDDYRLLKSSLGYEPLQAGTAVSSGISADAVELTPLSSIRNPNEGHRLDDEVLVVKGGDFAYKAGDTPVLRDVNLSIRRSHLTIVIGKVGSGKSTLLKALLGELTCSSGFVHAAIGSAAYCYQQSWLINGTVQQNIIGGFAMDQEWYKSVLHACDLEKDLTRFPGGDLALIGSKGLTLSGGQKQRVSLARALYARKEVVMIDDVLSGLDWTTEELVWDRCFGPQGLLRRHDVTVVLATHAVRHLRDAEHIVVLSEDGQISQQGGFEQLNLQSGYVRDLFLEEEKIKVKAVQTEPTESEQSEEPAETTPKASEEADLLRRTGEVAVYKYYLQSVGWKHGLGLLALKSLWAFTEAFPQVWLKWWAQTDSVHPGKDSSMYFGVYVALAILGVLMVFCSVW
jgi:ATP-binding cassette subfamily C (CFTR/MRP) protein 1